MADENLVEIIIKARDELSAATGKMENTLKQLDASHRKSGEAAKHHGEQTTALQQSLQSLGKVAPQTAGRLGEIVEAIGKLNLGAVGIIAAVGTATAGLIEMTLHAAEAANQLKQMSIRTGISVENLSMLKLGADLSDSSLHDVALTIRFLNRNMTEAIQTSGDARDAFKALNFDVKALKALSGDPLKALEEIGSALVRVKNATTRDALGLHTMGRSVNENLPLFQALAEGGFKAMREEAERFNAVVGPEFAEKSREFMDSLTRMKAGLTGLLRFLSTPFLSTGVDIFEALGFGAKGRQELREISLEMEIVQERLKGIAEETKLGIPEIEGEAERLRARLEMLQAAREALETKPHEKPSIEAKLPTADQKKLEEAVKAANKALVGQTDAVIAQIHALQEGEDVAARFALRMKLVRDTEEMIGKGAVLPPGTEARWDQYIARVIDLTRDLRGLKEAQEAQQAQEKADDATLTNLIEASQKLNTVFLTDREKELQKIDEWSMGLSKALEKAQPGFSGLAEAMSVTQERIAAGVARQQVELSTLFKTLTGVIDSIPDSMATMIESVQQNLQTVGDAFRNLARTIVLGFAKVILQEAFRPLQDALRNFLRETLAESGGSAAGGILGKIIGSIFGTIAGGSGGGGATVPEASIGLFGAAKGGIFPGGFTPLTSAGFRIAKAMQAYAKGGVLPGGFTPMRGFAVPAPEPALVELVHRFAHGGVMPGGFKPLHLAGVMDTLKGLPLRSFAGGGMTNMPTFGLIGDRPDHRFEAVIPMEDNRSIAVKWKNGDPGVSEQKPPHVHVTIQGDVIPRQPGMTKEQIVSIVVENFERDGIVRRMIRGDR